MPTETILILGGSFAGIGAAHYALRIVIPALPKKDGTTYNVTMVTPSTDFFFRVATPRAIVSKKMMPPSNIFYPIQPAFAYAKDAFTLVQGEATQVDSAAQTVSVRKIDGEQITVPYTALVIATGFTTPSPLYTLASSAADLEATHDAFRKELANAKTVVIAGAGPVGVESAGEIAEFLNGKPALWASAPKQPKAEVTLICAENKMLPVLRESLAKQAEKLLARLGANVVYNTKVVAASKAADGAKTSVTLSDGRTIEADVYIDATGTRPNTSFLPKEWLGERNRLACNPKTLRVEAAPGARIYALGDVGSYTRGGVVDIGDAVAVALTNLKTDLIAHLTNTVPGPDRHYTQNLKEQQLVPIGTQKGVGALGGMALPSVMVWAFKGRDYLVGMVARRSLNGDMYKKEGKWLPQPVQATGQAGLSSG